MNEYWVHFSLAHQRLPEEIHTLTQAYTQASQLALNRMEGDAVSNKHTSTYLDTHLRSWKLTVHDLV